MLYIAIVPPKGEDGTEERTVPVDATGVHLSRPVGIRYQVKNWVFGISRRNEAFCA
jgi:hypothetical protein